MTTLTVDERKALEALCYDLIYHGRHFSRNRDGVVIDKSVAYIYNLLFPNTVSEMLPCGCIVTKGFRCPQHDAP